jgi:hypothetical protein
MEPQYMIIGQAAGNAVAMALKSGVALQDIDTTRLTAKLRKDGAVLEYRPAAVGAGYFHELYSKFLSAVTVRQQIP